MKLLKYATLLLLSFMCLDIYADVECVQWDDKYISQYEIYINKITLDAQNIFNPEHPDETHKIHRLANVLHIQTRENTILQQLLFESGDKLDLRLLDETARNLRANRYIKDAVVYPDELCGNEVNIVVKTTDNWTLTPGVSYGRSSGNNKYGISIKEENLFGLGKKLSFSYSSDVDRKENVLRYTDPHFMSTRRVFSIMAQNNSDGEGYGFDYSLPFYQLDSRESWGISVETNRKISPLYDAGILSYEIAENAKYASTYYGLSDGFQNSRVNRKKIGWQYISNGYSSVNGSQPGITRNKLSYPWFEYETFYENYMQKFNFRTMGEVEDISLGAHLTGRIGLITEGMGSSDDYLYLSGRFSKGFHATENQLGLVSLAIDSYLGDGPLKGSELNMQGEWFWFENISSNYYFSANFNMIDNLLPGRQVVLGGNTGLRGYPIRYQAGDKSLLFTTQKHFFYKWYPYRLVQFGAVIFADVGSAWGQGKPRKFIADAGFGLRMVSTRSTGSSVLHADIAFPYNAPDNIDSYQIRLSAEKSL